MSLFKIPSPSPRLARNGYDLSSRRVFSAKAGELLPVGVWECNPSEHFSFQIQDLIRTANLNTAAYARMKEYYHFFFVSYKSLWQWFDQFIVGTPNPVSALNGVNIVGTKRGQTDYGAICSNVPTFDLLDLARSLYSGTAKSAPYDSQGMSFGDGAFKLLNMLGYGVTNKGKLYNYLDYFGAYDDKKLVDNKTSTLPPNSDFLRDFKYRVSPFRLLAYQKIFNDFYRNQDWSSADVASFNVDDFAEDNHLNIDNVRAKKFVQMRYRPYPKDWLTSIKPTPNYDKGIFNLPSYVTKSSPDSVSRDVGSTYISSSGTFSVNDLRAAFALDKMLEATRRANGTDYSSQIEAHFGFKVPESRAGDARFLGGFDNSVSISEVVSTSDTSSSSGAALGTIGGKGVGSLTSGRIDFDVKEHGIIMCIYSVAPQVEYNASYVDPFNRKLRREDFFQPEFADLGYQPILTSDLLFSIHNPAKNSELPSPNSPFSTGAVDVNNEVNNILLGWQVRYNEYKTARDVVFGDFETIGNLKYFTTPRFDLAFDRKVTKYTSSGFDSFSSGLSSRQFYVNPCVLNSIFLVDAREADHFYVNSFFDVKAVRPMSVHGLSSL